MDTALQYAASTIEHALMSRVAKSDPHAFSQLYDQSSMVLFSMALRMLGNREEAEGVLEDIYLDIWRKGVRYDVSRGTPIAWLITLTRNRAIDRLRNRGPRTRTHATAIGDKLHEKVQERTSGQFDAAADQGLRNLIHEALGNLPQAQQQAIELSYYEGLSPMEIASRLDQPVDTVKMCIRLGVSKLRESLQTYWQRDESA